MFLGELACGSAVCGLSPFGRAGMWECCVRAKSFLASWHAGVHFMPALQKVHASLCFKLAFNITNQVCMLMAFS